MADESGSVGALIPGYGSVVGVTEMGDRKSPCKGAGEDRWTRVLLENNVVLENVIGS